MEMGFECGLYIIWGSERNPCCVRVSFRHDQGQRACLIGAHTTVYGCARSFVPGWRQHKELEIVTVCHRFDLWSCNWWQAAQKFSLLREKSGLGNLLPHSQHARHQWDGKEDASQTCHYSHQCPAPSGTTRLTHNILLVGGRPPTW